MCVRRLLGITLIVSSLVSCSVPISHQANRATVDLAEAPTQTPWVILITPTPDPVEEPSLVPPLTAGLASHTEPTNETDQIIIPSVLAPPFKVHAGPGEAYPTWGYLSADDEFKIYGPTRRLPWVTVTFNDGSYGLVSAAPDHVLLRFPLQEYGSDEGIDGR